jgi:PAS domain S-box-containing protein
MVAGLGALGVWTQYLGHRFLGHSVPVTSADVVDLVIFLGSAVAIIALAQAQRTGSRKLADAQAERLRAQDQSLAALTESEERLRVAGEAARMAIWRSHPTEGFSHTPEFNAILGLPRDVQLTEDQVRAQYLPGELERVRAHSYAAFARGERQMEAEIQFRRADGAVRWIMMRAEMRANEKGEPRGAYGVAMDITDRKMSEERMTLLAREVDHRANNLLTVMLGTVQLSRAPTAEALRAVLLGRISALGRAHQLLSDARWQGADLRRLVEEELLAFSLGEAARVAIDGPDTALTPPAAQGLAMALHELATNAAKYGALSVPSGSVEVRWRRCEAGALLVRWTENGGPPVTRPTRHGLGTTILSRALSGPTNGTTRVDWRAEGLVCELELPAAALRADVAPGGSADAREGDVSPPVSPRPAAPAPRP